MPVPIDLLQRIKQIVGPLPPPGQLPGDSSYPYETVVPIRDGFVEREGVRSYFAVWGESVFSTTPGSPAYVSKAEHFRSHVPALGHDLNLQNHNAVQGTFHFAG